MTIQAKQILKEVLRLSALEKAELVESILESFNFTNRNEIDILWAKEVEDRINGYGKGKIGIKSAK